MTALIWRSLAHRKFQCFAVAITIALGVGIIFSIVMVYRGVAQGVELSEQRMGADIVVVPGDVSIAVEPGIMLFGGATENTYMPRGTYPAIQAIKGVKSATPQFFTQKLTADCHDIGSAIRMAGFDAASDWIIKPWLKQANISRLADQAVVIGAKVNTWNQGYMYILGKKYEIVTVAEETGTSLDYSIFVNMEEARRVVAQSSQLQKVWDKQGPPDQLISAVLVQIDKSVPLDEILQQIYKTGYVQPIVASATKEKLQQQFTVLAWLLGIVGGLAALIALFQLFARFYTLALERQAEWGVYLALGASSRDIAWIVIGEAIAVTLAGSLAGLLLGAVMYYLLLQLLSSYQSFPFIAPGWQFAALASLSAIAVFVVLGCLAAWLPAYQGSRISPSTVLTRGEFD
jgi:putative ABC transport system permease protein